MKKNFHDQPQRESLSTYQLLVADITVAVLETVKKEFFSALDQPTITANNEEVDLISVEQTLNLTNPPIGRTTLHHWQKAGKVTAYKVGKRVFYSKKAVTIFLTSVVKSHRLISDYGQAL